MIAEDGRLGAIRAVAAEALSSEHASRQAALEMIEQIAGASRTATGRDHGGAAVITPNDLETLSRALADAVEWRQPSGDWCFDCEEIGGQCADHIADAQLAAAYIVLGRKLGFEVDR